MLPFGLTANSKDRSFPLDLMGFLEVEGSSPFHRLGEGSGVLSTLELGVELNSEQMIEPESLQPVWSSTGAVKISMWKRDNVFLKHLHQNFKEISNKLSQSFVSEYL